MSSSLVLEDIKEGEQLKIERLEDEDDSSDDEVNESMTESLLFPAAKDNKDSKDGSGEAKDGEKKAEETSKDGKTDSKAEEKAAPEVDPLEKLRELVESLPAQEQEIVLKNLETIQAYPVELPLSAPWSESALIDAVVRSR